MKRRRLKHDRRRRIAAAYQSIKRDKGDVRRWEWIALGEWVEPNEHFVITWRFSRKWGRVATIVPKADPKITTGPAR